MYIPVGEEAAKISEFKIGGEKNSRLLSYHTEAFAKTEVGCTVAEL